MNHYAVYIWPCYILTFCLLGLNIVLTIVEKIKILKNIGLQRIE